MKLSAMFKKVAIALAALGFTGCIMAGAAAAVSSVLRFEARTGARNHGGRLCRYEVTSSTQCARRCVQHQDCNSYNLGPVALNVGGDGIGRNSRSCELAITDNNLLTTITREVGWTYMLGNSEHSLDRLNLICFSGEQLANGCALGLVQNCFTIMLLKAASPPAASCMIMIMQVHHAKIVRL